MRYKHLLVTGFLISWDDLLRNPNSLFPFEHCSITCLFQVKSLDTHADTKIFFVTHNTKCLTINRVRILKGCFLACNTLALAFYLVEFQTILSGPSVDAVNIALKTNGIFTVVNLL